MPAKLIQLDPQTTSTNYVQSHPELVVESNGKRKNLLDGTGLYLLFEIEGETFVFAGTRGGAVLCKNGGRIDDQNQSFFTQLAEELRQETFGRMILSHSDEEGYQLTINGVKHAITMQPQACLEYKDGVYAYAAFSAVCKTATLQELEQAAADVTPTASFWNKIGNYLLPHATSKSIPKDNENFAKYWASLQEARTLLIEELTKQYDQLTADGTLLVDPVKVLGGQNIAEALNTLNTISTFAELKKLFEVTAGDFSERPGYNVYKASTLLLAARLSAAGQPGPVRDITGQVVAKRGVMDDKGVTTLFPAQGITEPQGNLSADQGMFGDVPGPARERKEAKEGKRQEQTATDTLGM
jgi:hypothetical protein